MYSQHIGGIMKKKIVYFSLIFFIATCFFSSKKANAEFVPPEVETVMINEYSKPSQKIFTMQSTPLSITNVLNFVEKSTTRQPKQLLKYVYPTYSDAQLNSVTADLNQSNKYLLSQGYKTQIANGLLDTNHLKEELSNNRPVIAFLIANGDYWIEQETSIIIWGYQKITFPGRPSQIVYMFSSINHGSGGIYSGGENEIPLLRNESYIDPSANVTFKWVSTLYGFKK